MKYKQNLKEDITAPILSIQPSVLIFLVFISSAEDICHPTLSSAI
jgi:hypothetical protein